MNAQGVSAQARLGKSIMNRLHACWSVGGVVGAGIGSLASAAKIGLGVHLSCVALLQLATIAAASSSLLRVDPPVEPVHGTLDHPVKTRLISPTVIAMALMAIGIAWLEISPGDWGAVAMKDLFDAGKLVGFAPVVFAGMMLVGRLGGDHVLDRIGSRRLLTVALTTSAIGGLIVVIAPVTAVALIGFGVWGLGVSVIFPQLYAMAATLPGTAAGAGLGAMALGQRFGFMIGSVGVGAIADWQSLRWSFAVAVIGAVSLTLATRPILQGRPALVPAT